MKPLASIIISNYNNARYLHTAIESALCQTYPNVEVIVVDDGSTDGSPEVIASFGNLITSQFKRNSGQGAAINAGFRLSKGEVILFLDSDDWLMPETLERAIPALDVPRVAKVQWKSWQVVEGEITDQVFPGYGLNSGEVLPGQIAGGLHTYGPAPTSANLWARWWLERVLPMPEPTYRGSADVYLYTMAPLFGEVKTLPKVNGYYRMNQQGITAHYTPQQQLTLWDQTALLLRDALQRELGVEVDPEDWKRVNTERKRLIATISAGTEIDHYLPSGEPLLFIRRNCWERLLPAVERPLALISVDKQRNLNFADEPITLDALAEMGYRYLAIPGPALEPDEPVTLFRESLPALSRIISSTRHATIVELPHPAQPALPMVSIIINNFNYGQYLGDAIESALGQDYSDIEVIVVDDGSTDHSREVMASFGDQITPVFKPNGGQASAMNIGFAVSSGGIVIFLDADDVLLPEAAAEAAHALDGNSVVKAHWLSQIDDASGHSHGLLPKRKLSRGDLRERTIAKGPASYDTSPTSANAWARWFLERVMPIDQSAFVYHADAYLFTLAPLWGTIEAIDKPLTRYRVHAASRTASISKVELIALWETRAVILQQRLEEEGVVVSIDDWRANNRYYSRFLGGSKTDPAI